MCLYKYTNEIDVFSKKSIPTWGSINIMVMVMVITVFGLFVVKYKYLYLVKHNMCVFTITTKHTLFRSRVVSVCCGF